MTPAAAEFFGCNEPHTKVIYSPGYYPKRPDYRSAYAAQRQRHTNYSSRRSAARYRPTWWR
jgi:hypothetical protein